MAYVATRNLTLSLRPSVPPGRQALGACLHASLLAALACQADTPQRTNGSPYPQLLDVLTSSKAALRCLSVAAGSGLLLKSVTVFSATGSLVAAERPAGASLLAMDVHRLAAGNYTAVIVLSDNTTITRSFIKQ